MQLFNNCFYAGKPIWSEEGIIMSLSSHCATQNFRFITISPSQLLRILPSYIMISDGMLQDRKVLKQLCVYGAARYVCSFWCWSDFYFLIWVCFMNPVYLGCHNFGARYRISQFTCYCLNSCRVFKSKNTQETTANVSQQMLIFLRFVSLLNLFSLVFIGCAI